MMKLEQVLAGLRSIAAEELAQAWDHVGLQVGDPAQGVSRALLCIDLTEAVLAEAIAAKAQLIVAYHPPIFEPLAAVTSLQGKQRLILRAIQKGIALYSPHTALDAAPGGVNDFLAEGLGAGEVAAILPQEQAAGQQCKLVVFAPAKSITALRDALAQAGAGVIGDYTHCSYQLSGQGTFRGGAGANPVVGRRGRLEQVAEERLEMVCPAAALGQAVQALYRVHPYEEPAFDVYPLTPAGRQTGLPARVGQGRILTLDKPVTLAELVRRVKRHLGVRQLEVAAPLKNRPIVRIGICAGAGGSLLQPAGDIDAFLTGEMRHHDVLAAQTRGVAVLLAGHTQTERPFLPSYRRRLQQAVGKELTLLISRADRPPTRIV